MAFGDRRFGIIVRARTGQARRELAKLKADSTSTFAGATSSVVGLTAALGATAVALGAVSAGVAGFALKASGSLETAFSEVASISSFSADETERLRNEVRSLALEVGGDEIQAVKGLYQIISAGATDANEASILLGQSVRLAKAGLADLDTTAKAISSTVNSFSVEIGSASGRLADMFFETVRLGQTTIPELAASLGRVAKVANIAGVDIEELLAAVAALTKAGLSTDEAITAVRQALLAIAAPGSQAAAAFKEMGVQADAATLKQRGLAGVFAEIGKAVGGDIQKLKLLIPNIRAIVAAAVFADEQGLQLLIDSTKEIGEASGSVQRALGEFSDDLEFKLAQAAATAKGEIADLGRELTPFAITVLASVTKEMGFVVDLFRDWFKLLLDDGDKVVDVLKGIATGLALIAAALAGAALASGFAALGSAIATAASYVSTFGIAVAGLVSPVALIGGAIGTAAALVVGYQLKLRRAADEVERIADAVDRSNETIQKLGQADLGTLEVVAGVLADLRAQIVSDAAPGFATLQERLQATDGEAKIVRQTLEGLYKTLRQGDGAVADALGPADEAQKAAISDQFLSRLAKARSDIDGFSAGTKRALEELAPGLVEGAISNLAEFDALADRLQSRIDALKAEAADDAALEEATVPEVDPSIAALARLNASVEVVRESLATMKSETGEAFAEVARAGEDALGPGGALSPEAVRDLGDAFDEMDVGDLVDDLLGFGALEDLAEANAEALEGMFEQLQAIKKEAGELLNEDQLAAFLVIIETVADAIEEASEEMAESLRELKGELESTAATAKVLKSEFERSAQAFASSILTAVANNQNVLSAFVDWVKQRVIAVLAAEFAKLAFNAIPGGGGFLGQILFGSTQRVRPLSGNVDVGSRSAGLQVNVGIGAESMVEVITSDFRARRNLFRQGTRPEQLIFSAR